jgi:hypothetical protein
VFPVQSKRLSKNPFNPVSGNRSSQLSADTNAGSVVITIVGMKNDSKALPVQPSAMFVNYLKFPTLP